MNAVSQEIALTEIAANPVSRDKANVHQRIAGIAQRRAARAALLQDCLETSLTAVVFLGCLLFAAAALRLAVSPCALRHWGVLSIYAVAATVICITLSAIAKELIGFKKSFG